MDRYCEFSHKQRYISLKDLNNYFKKDELLRGLTEAQKEQLLKNIGVSLKIEDLDDRITSVKKDIDAFLLDADLSENAKDTLKEIQNYINSDVDTTSKILSSIIELRNNKIDISNGDISNTILNLGGKSSNTSEIITNIISDIQVINDKINKALHIDGIIDDVYNIQSGVTPWNGHIYYSKSQDAFVMRQVGETYDLGYQSYTFLVNDVSSIGTYNNYVDNTFISNKDNLYADSDGNIYAFVNNVFTNIVEGKQLYTDSPVVNRAVKELYIDTDYVEKGYYVHVIFRKWEDATNNLIKCQFVIFDADGNLVCQYYDQIVDADHEPPTFIELSSFTEGGISGYAVIDWSEIESGKYWYNRFLDQVAYLTPLCFEKELSPTIYAILNESEVGLEDIDEVIEDILLPQNVKYIEQTLTEEQQAQARKNINAVSVNDINVANDTYRFIINNPEFEYNDRGDIQSAIIQGTLTSEEIDKLKESKQVVIDVINDNNITSLPVLNREDSDSSIYIGTYFSFHIEAGVFYTYTCNLSVNLSDYTYNGDISILMQTYINYDNLYSTGVVLNVPQSFTESEQAQVRKNINAASADDIANTERITKITYSELVSLRDNGELIAGQMYRMTDYETMTLKAGSQSAGHPFDLVLTALDNKTLDEKCSAIWSERDTDGYFANSNLPAWDVRYCLDNDTSRFGWAVVKGKSIGVDLSAVGAGNVTATLNGTFVYEDTTYTRWDASVSVEGMTMDVYILTPSEDVTIGSTPILYRVADGQGMEIGTITSVMINENDGKGVIYRLVDENRNDIPYDFKNIQFVRKITDGALDLEGGTDTFCYTFSDFSSGVLLDDSFGTSVSNVFGTSCWDNVFLGNGCNSNSFGDMCYSNTFGYNFYENSFRSDCYGNTFGYNCHENSFGSGCHSNTFGIDCNFNNFGNNCNRNTFGTAEAPLSNIKNYKVDCVTNTEIAATADRNFVTYVTKNSAGNVVQYTIDDILNA